jgi:homoserine O-acetyltransferase
VTYANLHSTCGHDAFLLPNDVDRYGEMISAFLANLDSRGAIGVSPVVPLHSTGGDRRDACPTQQSPDADDGAEGDVTSIFHRRRLDYDQIVQFIPAGASVLDLGCGSGGLLDRLRRRGSTGSPRIMGVELDGMEILRCVRRGLDVVQMDLNRRLESFADGQFDCVVLSQTLQTIRDVPGVLGEMLRVGRRGVVSFPNFAYHKLRRMLWEEGRAPEAAGGLLHHAWYDTPNIRFLSIEDFRTFCSRKGIRIEREAFLDTEAARPVTDDPNSNADLAIFVIAR